MERWPWTGSMRVLWKRQLQPTARPRVPGLCQYDAHPSHYLGETLIQISYDVLSGIRVLPILHSVPTGKAEGFEPQRIGSQ